MRFKEFNILLEQQNKFYTIGDSHAVAVATAGGPQWVNLAIGGRPSTDAQMLSNISQIPKGAIVLVSQGANDTANAARAHMDSKGKRPLKPAREIAANVASVVDRVEAQGAKVVFLLFPNGPSRGAGLAKYYGGDYQDEVRKAIRSAIGNVKVIDLDGSPLTDGVHATMGSYKKVAEQVMRFNEFSNAGLQKTNLGPAGTAPGAPATKNKPESEGDVNNPLFNPKVLELQKKLKAAGANLGSFGPNRDGLDGVMGIYTRRAAARFPDIAKSYQDLLDKPNPTRMKFDTKNIQDPDFNRKLEKIAKELGVRKEDLIAIFKQESGLDHTAVNKMSGATGLIQFMPDTAASLGTTTAELRKMSAVQQLDYVYMYFKKVGVRPGMKLGDLYMAVFMPKYVGSPDNTVLGQAGAKGFSGKVYDQNRGLDKNKDGKITVADVKQSVERFA